MNVGIRTNAVISPVLDKSKFPSHLLLPYLHRLLPWESPSSSHIDGIGKALTFLQALNTIYYFLSLIRAVGDFTLPSRYMTFESINGLITSSKKRLLLL